MSPREDRAASEVIGAVILFGFLVIAFTIYQGVVIPQQNRVVEFEHNQAAQDSIQDLRNAIRGTATAGTEQSVSISLAARYPPRVLGINPGVSAGSVQTEPIGSLVIRNISATDPEAADYFGSATTTLGPLETKALTYRPHYSRYTQAPTTSYEHSVAYNQFPSGVNLSITDQVVVDGRKITLIALGGNLSEASQGGFTVDTQAVSTATRSISVTNGSGPINITLPTQLSAADWEELLEDELDPAGTESEQFVRDVKQTGPGQVSIILEPGTVYELRLAKVGVGTATPSEPAKYIVDVEGDGTSVIENGTRKLVVEVRDRYNNPVSNVTVNASVEQFAKSPDDSVTPLNATTGADGRASFTYAAPAEVDGTKTAVVNATFDGDGTVRNETVSFDIRVLDADGSGGGDGDTVGDSVNPAGTNSVVLIDQDINQTKCGTVFCRVDVTLENRNSSNDREIVEVRVNFYGVDRQSATDPGPPESTEISNVTHVIGDDYQTIEPIVIAAGSQTTFTMPFYEDEAATTPYNEIEVGDFYLLSVIFDNGQTVTYFIGPQEP